MEKPSNSADQLAHSSKIERVVKWLDITTSPGNYFFTTGFPGTDPCMQEEAVMKLWERK